MVTLRNILNAPLTGIFMFGMLLARDAAAQAQSDRVQELLDQLAQPDLPNWEMVEGEIWTEWSKSGSPAMDLLLKRGREAMDSGDLQQSLEHLTALTDHAPNFAEGFNARASAYFQLGMYGPALEDIRRALILNPQHFGAMIGLGSIFEEMGQPEKALRAMQSALAIHPHEPDLKETVERLERANSGLTL